MTKFRKCFIIFTSQLEVCCYWQLYFWSKDEERSGESDQVLSGWTDGNTGEVKQTGNTGTEIITVTLCAGTRFFKSTKVWIKKRDLTPLFIDVSWFVMKYQLLCVISSLWHLFQQQHFKQNAFSAPVSADWAALKLHDIKKDKLKPWNQRAQRLKFSSTEAASMPLFWNTIQWTVTSTENLQRKRQKGAELVSCKLL